MKTLLLILVVLGLVWYAYHRAHPTVSITDTAHSIATQTATDIDTATQKSFGGVSTAAQVYYLRNRNYGSSAAASICTAPTSSEGLGDIVSAMQKLGSTVSCTVDPKYPSKSFTLTVPSVAHKGQYYCTDQNGYVGLIPSLVSTPFEKGLQCK